MNRIRFLLQHRSYLRYRVCFSMNEEMEEEIFRGRVTACLEHVRELENELEFVLQRLDFNILMWMEVSTLRRFFNAWRLASRE